MILVGNQRGGARDLALHLLKEENEHVEVHETRGFASKNLASAPKEAHAIRRATKCRRIKAQNEQEAYDALRRDRAEKEELIFTHLDQRRTLKTARQAVRRDYHSQEQELAQDIQTYKGMRSDLRGERLQEYGNEGRFTNVSNTPKTRHRGRSLER